ncbi:MAG: YkgJ family cysteine cluster protein [Gemmatimonadota bacterium]|nr:YkgJ family cysteine cluster protein [Gemmatimonadota bacterium]
MGKEACVDCEKGREMGCGTYCCRLIVRLAPHERERYSNGDRLKSCVDKDRDGYCVHFDRGTHLCQIWDQRPEVCRAYSCNTDPMLQVALRETWHNIVDLARLATERVYATALHIRVPETNAEGMA